MSGEGKDRNYDPQSGKYFDKATGKYSSIRPVDERGVALDADLQEAANKKIIEEVRAKLDEDEKESFDNVQELINLLKNASSSNKTEKEITSQIIEKSRDIGVLSEKRPSIAELLMTDIVLAIKNNPSIGPWRERYITSLQKALARLPNQKVKV